MRHWNTQPIFKFNQGSLKYDYFCENFDVILYNSGQNKSCFATKFFQYLQLFHWILCSRTSTCFDLKLYLQQLLQFAWTNVQNWSVYLDNLWRLYFYYEETVNTKVIVHHKALENVFEKYKRPYMEKNPNHNWPFMHFL